MRYERDENGFIVLKPKCSELYKNVNYLTPLPRCVNSIYEYDIKHANLSMLWESGYLSGKQVKQFEEMGKQARNVTIGKMILKDRRISKIISNGIIQAKQNLFMENNIQDSEIISIKNDAIFICGRKLKTTTFGKVEFVVKNRYTLFHKINNLEFYSDVKNQVIHVKGLDDNILEEPDHQNGILQFLLKVFRYLMYDRMDDLREYLLKFVDDYKNYQLPHEYYRELNAENIYRLKYIGFDIDDDYTFNLDYMNEKLKPELNINYNYIFYVLPILRLYL